MALTKAIENCKIDDIRSDKFSIEVLICQIRSCLSDLQKYKHIKKLLFINEGDIDSHENF